MLHFGDQQRDVVGTLEIRPGGQKEWEIIPKIRLAGGRSRWRGAAVANGLPAGKRSPEPGMRRYGPRRPATAPRARAGGMRRAVNGTMRQRAVDVSVLWCCGFLFHLAVMLLRLGKRLQAPG